MNFDVLMNMRDDQPVIEYMSDMRDEAIDIEE